MVGKFATGKRFRLFALSCLIVFIVLTYSATFNLLHKAPWLGLNFVPVTDPTVRELSIQSVNPESPLFHRLKPGLRLRYFSSGGDSAVLRPSLFISYSDTNDYQDLQRFFAEKRRLYDATSGQHVFITDDSNRVTIVDLVKDKPWSSTASKTWVIYGIGLFVLLLACVICIKHSILSQTILSIVTGFGVYIACLNHLLLQREIGLAASYFEWLVSIDVVLSNGIFIAIIIILVRYPVRLLSNVSVSVLIGAVLLSTMNDYFVWVEMPFHSFYLKLLIVLGIIFYRFFMIKGWPVKVVFSLLSIILLLLANYALVILLQLNTTLALALSGILIAAVYYGLRTYLVEKMHLITNAGSSDNSRQLIQDIHDTVGASLLTLKNQMKTPQDVERVKVVIQILRDTIRLSSDNTNNKLEDILADNQAEARERIELANCSLVWEFEDKQTDCNPRLERILTLNESITLSNFFREAISNALKHAQANIIHCVIRLNDQHLHIFVCNDGEISDPEKWQMGFGLNNMKARLERLGGKFVITLQNPGKQEYIQLEAIFPLRRL